MTFAHSTRLINLVSLLLLSVSPLAFSSRSSLSPNAQHATQSVGLWYNVLLSWPVFVVCFWVNVSALYLFVRDCRSACDVLDTHLRLLPHR